MGTHADAFSFIEYDDFVCMHNGTDALCNNQIRSVAGMFFKVATKCGVGLVVERRKTIVKNVDFWIARNCACDCEALLLATRNIRTALCDMSVVVFVHFFNKAFCLSDFDSLLDCFFALFAAAVIAVSDVARNGTIKHYGLLWYVANAVVKRFLFVVANIYAVDKNFAIGCVVKTWNEINERRFAGAS